MKDPRDHLFTCTILARDEHVGVGWSNALDQIENGFHRRRFGDDLRYVTRRFGNAVAQREVFGFRGTVMGPLAKD